MMDAEQQKPPLTTSMFYMWRSLLAVAWADGNCGQEETDYFAKLFDNLSRYFDLTQQQRDALADDLVTPKKIDELLSYINDPDARNLLVVYAEDLIVLDGVVDPTEEDVIKRLHIWQHPAYDKEALRTEIRGFVAERRRIRAKAKENYRRILRSHNPFFAAADTVLKELGMDILD